MLSSIAVTFKSGWLNFNLETIEVSILLWLSIIHKRNLYICHTTILIIS